MADETSFPTHPTDVVDCKMESDMDKSVEIIDQSVDDGSRTAKFQQASTAITMEDLYDAFDIQNQYLKSVLDAELDKRFPAQDKKTIETPGTLGSNLTLSASHHTNAAINVEELLQQHADLSHECQRLQAMNNDARQRIVSLENRINENADLEAQINTVNEKNASLTQRMAALRQMLIPPSENQIIDSEIVQRFTRIRSGILTLVRQTWKPAIKPEVKNEDLTAAQLKVLNVELTYDRLRSVVFSRIHKNVFGGRPYFLGNARSDIEKSLRNVEQYLIDNTPEDNESSIMNWRNATFKATEGLRDIEGTLSQHTRRQVWGFLSPLQIINPQGTDRALERLQAICDEAVELSMMIRQAKDRIFVATCKLAIDTPFSSDNEIMEEATFVKADADHRRGTVAYVICGALIKKPKDDLRQTIVLEKADVAVYH